MPWGLKRYHHTAQSHFVTFCCYHRRLLFTTDQSRQIFEAALERVRHNFRLRVYGYVVMLEHVHLLLSEPERDTLADALKSLKQGVARRLIADAAHFWQKRYYDFNVRNHEQFIEKLHYIHCNPVRAGLCERPPDWPKTGRGAAFFIMRRAARDESKSNQNGLHANATAPQADLSQQWNCPTQAKTRLEWATPPTVPLFSMYERKMYDHNLTLGPSLGIRSVRSRNAGTESQVDRLTRGIHLFC